MKLFAAVLALLVSGASGSRLLYAGYEPLTPMNDHAGIAGDQAAIEKYLKKATNADFLTAQQIYEEGGSSKSYAMITLSAPLATTINKGTQLTAKAMDGTTDVVGKALATYTADGSLNMIGFQYPTVDSYLEYSECMVGALPTADQVTTGCLMSAGQVTVDQQTTPLDYTNVENKNARTIKGFSVDSNTKFKATPTSANYFAFYNNYLNYYGVNTHDFADKIVMAGFAGGSTSLANGNINLAGYSFEGREQIVKKGTAYIVILLYVFRELEDALVDCDSGCTIDGCNEDAVHATDEGVGFYVGSLFPSDPNEQGNLAYGLAEKRALNFATASEDGGLSGTSNANVNIMTQFKTIKNKLNQGQCDAARENVDEIYRLAQIPQIQGTLRYAYFTSVAANPTEAQQTEAAIFAASILPNVHACDSNAAATIYNNVALTPSANKKADFGAVKSAFESVYECLRVTCAEIGGLVDDTTGNTYVTGTEPCGGHEAVGVKAAANSGDSGSSSSDDPNVGAIVGGVIAAVVVLALVGFFVFKGKSRNTKETDTGATGGEHV